MGGIAKLPRRNLAIMAKIDEFSVKNRKSAPTGTFLLFILI